MNFGHVFITLFKWLTGISVVLSASISATSYEMYLKEQVKENYSVLNNKIALCNKDRKESFDKTEITNKWFNGLSKKDRGEVIIMLTKIADERCYALELKSYSDSVVQYTSNTGDQSVMEDWLILRRLYASHSELEAVAHIDFEKVIALSEEAPFDQPFNGMSLLTLYR
ncbi:hypothetical protein VIBNISFn27_970161 [Vibrio nigripulchritudo SFn27]|uniref:hypothetical protein n=1 Tax=Vibrio nigripulchritudo TaxID=28173 RepID=UPI0003B18AD7|nr:hypothetical protein [Vibrio nigripulchritudo]CCN81602.1 hypothetical protein VIBNIBLFn1_240160 [Vibrio nigripulchritudo BLFn1]CCN91699.1 hypothetical protein VIBNISFn27_970161 [Vibrio nigripulchritudo SFn27]CCN96583.1 hypothetical protein VIBNIENn2_780160 [Vibrio nigripulchritudo ENn2]CCO38457.1 hypothetical protein VIBNISFn135_100162 [Vibrio nigripulchritudo SFn135]CCO53914.1 hypothetical protein VIBNIWn13_600162 [Vibrio nigripulchritudo Wn13]